MIRLAITKAIEVDPDAAKKLLRLFLEEVGDGEIGLSENETDELEAAIDPFVEKLDSRYSGTVG